MTPQQIIGLVAYFRCKIDHGSNQSIKEFEERKIWPSHVFFVLDVTSVLNCLIPRNSQAVSTIAGDPNTWQLQVLDTAAPSCFTLDRTHPKNISAKIAADRHAAASSIILVGCSQSSGQNLARQMSDSFKRTYDLFCN